MEQFKHTGRLLFQGISPPPPPSHARACTCGLICCSLLDRCEAEGKPIDFLPIWLRADPEAASVFIPPKAKKNKKKWEEGAEKRHTCFCQSPWQQGSWQVSADERESAPGEIVVTFAGISYASAAIASKTSWSRPSVRPLVPVLLQSCWRQMFDSCFRRRCEEEQLLSGDNWLLIPR